MSIAVRDIADVRSSDDLDTFDAIVTVCQDHVADHVPEHVAYHWFQMADGPDGGYGGDHSYGLFRRAADTVRMHESRGERVLVHCHMGQSRSVSVASAAHAAFMDWSFDESFEDFQNDDHVPDGSLMKYGERYVNEN